MKKTKEIAKKLFRAIKSVLLSIFYMDYQVESQKPALKMKASRLKLVVIALAAATIIWAIAFYTTPWKYISIGIILAAGWLGFIVVAIGK